MTILFANNASSTLASGIDDDDLILQVETGTGALFPSPSGGDYFIVTMQNANGDIERMHCTSRTTDLLTVTRGEEGTAAQTWVTGDRVENRLSKETLEAFLQKTGGAMSGDINLATNEIQNAELTGTTVITGGKTVGTLIRGAVNDASNQISVPSNGTQATAGGSPITTTSTFAATLSPLLMAAFPTGSVILWFGSSGSVPAGWQLCNGTNGTPDLRDRVPIGAGTTYNLNDAGGSTSVSGNTGNAGGHSHGGVTGGHALTAAENGPHTHGSISVQGTHNTGLNSTDPINAVVSNNGVTAQRTITNSSSASSGSGDAHTHPISAEADHNHTFSGSTLPPYRALYFIMKL